ncbi:hypothetical protein LVD13_12220 [Flavobacteriaceae bacterium D16]|nr:hypothetical protein [Flavobacteriaceae bacterium D16]
MEKNNKCLREEIGRWFKNYSNSKYGSDWDYCVGLSYRDPVNSNKIIKSKISGLYKYLSHMDDGLDGFYTSEYSSTYSGLHNHLLVKTSISDSKFQYHLINYWKRNGISDIKRYDPKQDYSFYITKHLYKTEKNIWDFFSD